MLKSIMWLRKSSECDSVSSYRLHNTCPGCKCGENGKLLMFESRFSFAFRKTRDLKLPLHLVRAFVGQGPNCHFPISLGDCESTAGHDFWENASWIHTNCGTQDRINGRRGSDLPMWPKNIASLPSLLLLLWSNIFKLHLHIEVRTRCHA